MLTTSQRFFTLQFNATRTHAGNLCASTPLTSSRPNFQFLANNLSRSRCRSRISISRQSRLRAYELEGGLGKDLRRLDFDSFISNVELICLFSSTVVWIGFVVKGAISGSKKIVLDVMGERVLVWGVMLLVGANLIASWTRRRQWSLICGVVGNGRGKSLDLVERIEKSEEELRSLATVVRALSRQLEKLGTRFRVTRKALKDPIAESAALVKKNSEATRALAVQADVLEKELGEVQKVLLAMQDQQKKQLELFLAVVNNGKLERRTQPEQGNEKQSI